MMWVFNEEMLEVALAAWAGARLGEPEPPHLDHVRRFLRSPAAVKLRVREQPCSNGVESHDADSA